MILVRIHSTENKFVLIFYVLCEMFLRRCHGKKSIFGFFVSLGAKYPFDLRSMIQFWIFPKKRTLNFIRVKKHVHVQQYGSKLFGEDIELTNSNSNA